ncbi:MAG TPA: DUF736 domain-containing protein [Asticcacaulis sp.]|nr:DUF736 domain-containing protein [Asticcacaulis sp.]
MATIGTFTKAENGFSGAIKTLTLNIKARLSAVEEPGNERGPDYRVFTGATEFGAGWKKTAQSGREYISVKLDDPSLPAPIYASLVEADEPGGYTLIWSRPHET